MMWPFRRNEAKAAAATANGRDATAIERDAADEQRAIAATLRRLTGELAQLPAYAHVLAQAREGGDGRVGA